MRKKREKPRSAPASDSPEAATRVELAPLAQRFRQFADDVEAKLANKDGHGRWLEWL